MRNMKPVIVRLRQSLSYAEKITDEMWQMMMSRTSAHMEDPEWLEQENELTLGLSSCLEQLGDNLSVALEMLGLPDTRRDFLKKWSCFRESGLGQTEERHNDNGDFIVSLPLQLCWNIFHMIEAPYESLSSGEETRSLEILDYILESTAKIVGNTCIKPTKESDVQKPMHKHLAATFSEFTPQVTISKPIMSFKPDCGIIDLKAAIEFKSGGRVRSGNRKIGNAMTMMRRHQNSRESRGLMKAAAIYFGTNDAGVVVQSGKERSVSSCRSRNAGFPEHA